MKTKLSILSLLLLGAMGVMAKDVSPVYYPGIGGSVTMTQSGDNVTLTAEPSDAAVYQFVEWQDGNKENPRIVQFQEGSADIIYTACFARKDLSTSEGTVTVEFNGQVENAWQFKLTAQGTGCLEPWDWSNGDNGAVTYITEDDCVVTPSYVQQAYSKNVTSPNDNTIVMTDNGDCHFQLTATPAAGYTFCSWQDDFDGKTNPTRMVDFEDANYAAVFAEAPFQVGELYYTSFVEAKTASISSATPIILYANATDDIVIAEDDDITIDGNDKTLTGDITIEKGGKLTLTGDKTLTANNLYLESEKSNSSQLVGAANLTLSGDAYFDITLEEKVSSKWYAIAVPFTVDGKDGIYVGDEKKENEKDFRLAKWDGEKRASTGTGFQYPYNGKLEAGKLYMLTIADDDNVWRFKKDGEAALVSSNTITLKEFASGTSGNAGWNAVANPTLYYADASVETTIKDGYAYIYNNETSAYETKTLAECSFVVGSPMVVQSGADQTMTFETATQSTLYAPTRNTGSDRLRYKVTISDGKTEDAMYLTASEDAEDRYVIGRDFQKMRNAVPQLWTVAYGEKLAAQDAVLADSIVYQMGLYAPKAGEYTLSATTQSDANLYLLQDGITLWNMNESSYTLSLNKGDNTNYSLVMKVSRKITTAIGEMDDEFKLQNSKFIKDGQLYIEINNQTYNAQGGIVK